jgi:hypothetical protein
LRTSSGWSHREPSSSNSKYGLDSAILAHNFLQTRNMEYRMDFGSSRKGQFVSHITNMLDDLVGSIKLRCQFFMSLSFERCFLVRLEPEKHLDHLPEKPFLNDVDLPIASCDFGPCGGYPSDPLEWLYDLATLYQ